MSKKPLIILMATLISIIFIGAGHANSPEYSTTLESYKLIDLQNAQSNGLNGSGQTIVVIDTGVQTNHPYLNGIFVDGNCTSRLTCGNDYLVPSVSSGRAHKGDGAHGSMVAGIIAGQVNSNAPGGIAPKAQIISIDNTDGGGEGLLLAMNWILSIQKKYNVVAVSASIEAANPSQIRGNEGTCSLDPALANKIKELVSVGISMVFATGNDGSLNNLGFPACLPDVISVGALTSTGNIQGYSNISKSLTVLAPADVISSNGSSGYFLGGGTSAATPVVAGVIALLKQAKPDATTQEIKRALQSTRTRISDVLWSNIPVLDAFQAIQAIKTGNFDTTIISSSASQINSQSQINPTPIPKPAPTTIITAQPTPHSNIDLVDSVKLLTKQVNSLQAKLKKICAAKPRPKGC